MDAGEPALAGDGPGHGHGDRVLPVIIISQSELAVWSRDTAGQSELAIFANVTLAQRTRPWRGAAGIT